MATAKKTQIVITANAAVAKKVMDELQQRIDALKQRMLQLDTTTDAGKKEFKKLEKELVSYNSAVTQNVTNTERVRKAINNLSGTSLKELRRALVAAKSELGKTFENDPNLKKRQQDVKTLQAQIDKLTGAVNKHGNAWSTAAKNLVAYVGMFGAFNMIKQKITDVINLNFKYSDSLANVRKVTNWSMKDVEELSNSLSKMDTRTSLEGLTQLAYIGSRMGMGKYGVQGLAEFAKASDRVNVALKEDLGDDAMLILSKFVETMGEVEKHGGNVGEAFDSVSSSIFKLASTSTANGGNILEFAKRLTGLSKSAHITSDQLLGLASASDSLMLMPEVASTAFGKLITSLWTNYHDIEKMLGMQEDSLKDMMSKGQTMQALVKVLENVSDKNLSSMDEYFKEFGSDGQRLKSVVVTMAQNIGVLKSHLKESSEAYREGTAVTKEYEIQQETAQAILERANNMWEKAFVNPNGIDAVKEMAKVWYNFSKELTQSKPFLASVKILFWELKTSVEALLFVLPGLLAYLGTRGLVMAFSKLIPLMIGIKGSSIVSFFTLLTQAIKGSHIATLRLIVSWKQLSLAMKTNIIGLVISVVTSLGVAIYDLVKKTNKASSSVQKFNSSFKGVRDAANHAVAELDAYYGAIKRAKKGSNEYQAAMKTYVDKFGMYFKKLKDENGMVQNLAESYRQAAKAIRGKIYLQMQEDDIQKHYKPRIVWSLDKLDAYGKVAPKGFGTDVLKGYEEDNRNKNMGTIIADLARRYGSKNVARVLASEKEGRSSAQVRKVYKDTLGDGTVRQYVKYEDLPIADQRLFSALRYIRQARSANNVFAGIKNKFAGAQDEINDYLKAIDAAANEDLGGGGGGKGGSGGGGKNTPKTDNTAKQEEQKAKTRANALIANIKAFYEEQKRKYLEWVTQMNADGEKVSEGQQQQMLALLDAKTKTALGTARKSIATMSDDFKKFFSHMDEDVLIYDDETSKSLLESIGKSDISELHALFQKLSGDLSRENNKTLSENLGALLDQIFANGSKELREAAEKLLAQQREIQKILNENDYTGAVNRSTRSDFDKLRFLRPASGVDAATEEGLQKMNDAFDKLTTKARSTVAVLYTINPESQRFQQQFLDYLSVANSGFDFTKLNTQELKALYIELIKYTDSYTEAEKRKYDYAKKIADQAWKVNQRNLANQETLRKMQQESALFGKRTNMWSNLGLGDLTADPEVELMKMKMQMAEDYYAFVFKNSKNQQLIDEAERARQEAELAYANQMATAMKNRLSQMQQLVQPIETFGSEVGKAFAEMRNDVSSAQEAIKNALKSMLESWANMALNDVNTQMWKAINDAGAKRGKRKAQPGIDAARANADANAVKEDFSNLGTKANPMYVRLVDEGAAYLTPQPQSNFEKMPPQQPALGWNPDGTPINPNSQAIVPPYAPPATPEQQNTQAQGNGAPRAWEHRNRDNANAFYNDAATQTGTAAADAIAGGGSFADAAAGITGSFIGGVMNTEFKTGGKSKEDKEKADQLKKEKKHQKELSKEVKKGNKDREKVTTQGVQNITNVTDAGNKEQTEGTKVALNAGMAMTQTALTENLNKTQENNEAIIQSDADRTQAGMTFSIAGAIGKCFDFLGPIAGPIAAAGVMATLMGLLQWALNSAFSGGKKKSNTNTTNTKLVTGMLTYDSGNVQDLKPFVADNGEVYWAKEDDGRQMQGVKMLTSPTATTVNGQPSLIAERGPEIVIGRETTHAMMMNNPGLLKALVNYDRNYSGRNSARRAFDDGNVGDVLAAGTQAGNGNLSSGASVTGDLIAANAASNAALLQAVNALLQRLNEPINAKINMFGRGELYDSLNKANQFMKNK
jgi:TP901 family phage tail tape measure protein